MIHRAFQLLWATLREIFDEAAYDRYLAQHHCAHSRESFEAFSEANRLSRERRPRCC
jgi:hypothetical protein